VLASRLGGDKWQSAWAVHIQLEVASGRSAAVESSTPESESRVAAGVRGFKFTVSCARARCY
jgi:hypothetical protein